MHLTDIVLNFFSGCNKNSLTRKEVQTAILRSDGLDVPGVQWNIPTDFGFGYCASSVDRRNLLRSPGLLFLKSLLTSNSCIRTGSHRCHRICFGFQWYGHAVVVRYDSSRVVCCRAGRRHCRVCKRTSWLRLPAGEQVSSPVVPDRRRSRSRRKVPAARHRAKVIETDLNLKYVLRAVSLNLHFAEAHHGQFLFQSRVAK